MSRRKTKTERELVADINDAFRKFCYKQDCVDCPYRLCVDCKIEYIKDIIKLNDEEDMEE